MDEAEVIQERLSLPREANAPPAGHDKIEQMLLKLAGEERLPHALIFSGLAGIGKATMAFRLGRYLLAGNFSEATSLDVSRENRVFKQVSASGHPDLLTIEKPEGKNAIPVDEARRIAPFLQLTSSYGGWRIAIVDDADTMNRNAQNAILKVLEEPPDNALLILIVHRLGAMVPTIRSRCRVINFQPLENQEMLEVLEKSPAFMGVEVSSRQALLDISQGSPGRALRYLANGSLEIFESVISVLREYPKINWQSAHKLADMLASSGMDAAYYDFQAILIDRLQAAIKAKALSQRSEMSQIFEDCALADLVKICENLEQHFVMANNSNLDKRQTVLGSFMILRNSEQK